MARIRYAVTLRTPFTLSPLLGAYTKGMARSRAIPPAVESAIKPRPNSRRGGFSPLLGHQTTKKSVFASAGAPERVANCVAPPPPLPLLSKNNAPVAVL